MHFPLIGEPLALDLVNTRPNTEHGPTDLLSTPAELRTWLDAQAGRLEPGVPDEDDLALVQAVRDHVAAAVGQARQGRPPADESLQALIEAQRAAPAIRDLSWNGTAITATLRRDGSLGARLAAQLAESAADLLADPAITRVRPCEADDCVLLFLPAHPRRRWCSATRCGNRARVARYYQRHKTT